MPERGKAQTAGLVYKIATNGGSAVLDPNQDGYTSLTQSGFTTSDELQSEIPFRRFPTLGTEPIGDLPTGATGGATDFAQPPLYAYFDGTNLLFRFRVSGQSTASKGYSVLIDANNTFSGTGVNPGFEFEVLLAANFSVQVLDLRGATPQPLFSGNINQYQQRSVALTTQNGDPDYFYDIYVPLSAFNGAITASTPLRMSGITIISAQSGITGTVSDVGGVNDAAYNYNRNLIWKNIIETFPATSLSDLRTGTFSPLAAVAPVVNGPIRVGATSISGTSAEAAGTLITLFRNGVALCGGAGMPTCPTVRADGTWTITGISPTLIVAGDVFTATATATGKTVSSASAGVVVTAGPCTTPAPTSLTTTTGNKGITGLTSVPGEQLIQVYRDGALYGSITVTAPATAPTTPFAWTVQQTNTGNAILAGSYTATTTPTGGCQSPQSLSLCHSQGNTAYTATAAPAITTAQLMPASTTIAGTVGTSGLNVYVYINGRRVATTTSTAPTTSPNWSASISGLAVGDVVTARAIGATNSCLSPPSNQVTVVQTQTAAPVITGTYCGQVTRVSGTSTEPQGTSIRVFYTPSGAANATLIGTTTVNAFGVWALNVPTTVTIPTGSRLTAFATAPNKSESAISNAVTVGSITSATALVVTEPIREAQTSVTGTYPTPDAIIKIYVDGIPIATDQPIKVLANGTWGITGLSPFELFAGANVTATAQTANNCESVKSQPVVVQCAAPEQRTINPLATAVCSGSAAQIQVFTSQRGIVYQLESAPDGTTNFTRSGSAVTGNGSTITLVSAPVTARSIFRVVASKVSGTTCSTVLNQTATILATPLPEQGSSVISGPATVCANTAANISVSNTNAEYRYQLRKGETAIGAPLVGTGGMITLPTDPIISNSTYNVFVTNLNTGCGTQFPSTVTIAPGGPSATQAVTVANSSVCLQGSTTLTVATEANTNYSYQVFERVGTGTATPVGSSFNGTGGTFSRTLGPFTTTGERTYFVEVTNNTPNTACRTVRLATQPRVRVSNQPIIADAGPTQYLCGASSATLQGNTPANGTGQWTTAYDLTTDPEAASRVVIANPTSPSTTVSGLRQGYTYFFRWSITSSCGGTEPSTNLTSIKINCPSYYNVAPPQFVNTYSTGDVLAVPMDIDRGITGAELVEGTNIPVGVQVNPLTGVVTVGYANALVPGVYSFRVRLIDQTDNATVVTVTLQFYGEQPNPTPLPVDLISFTGQALSGGAIQLDWRTASERNNDRFLVQHSADGYHFTTVGTVAGNGTTGQLSTYSFVHRNPGPAMNYYRLVQVDYDGAESRSPVVAVHFSGGEETLQVFPNPVERQAQVRVQTAADEQLVLQVQDMKGVTLLQKQLTATGGKEVFTVDLSRLANGVYMLIVEGETVPRQAVRIVKVR